MRQKEENRRRWDRAIRQRTNTERGYKWLTNCKEAGEEVGMGLLAEQEEGD